MTELSLGDQLEDLYKNIIKYEASFRKNPSQLDLANFSDGHTGHVFWGYLGNVKKIAKREDNIKKPLAKDIAAIAGLATYHYFPNRRNIPEHSQLWEDVSKDVLQISKKRYDNITNGNRKRIGALLGDTINHFHPSINEHRSTIAKAKQAEAARYNTFSDGWFDQRSKPTPTGWDRTFFWLSHVFYSLVFSVGMATLGYLLFFGLQPALLAITAGSAFTMSILGGVAQYNAETATWDNESHKGSFLARFFRQFFPNTPNGKRILALAFALTLAFLVFESQFLNLSFGTLFPSVAGGIGVGIAYSNLMLALGLGMAGMLAIGLTARAIEFLFVCSRKMSYTWGHEYQHLDENLDSEKLAGIDDNSKELSTFTATTFNFDVNDALNAVTVDGNRNEAVGSNNSATIRNALI